MSLLDVEQHLATRFAALRDGRSGPVFFIEHALPVTELQELAAAVRDAVQRHPPEGGWWRGCPLPLIVSATEVGYRYRGAGTDFWPLLEAELNIDLSPISRQCIRDLFADNSSVYRGAKPPDTPWAQAFHLIAWPITHALVPLEFHRPWAAALANLRTSVSNLDDLNLYRALRVAAGHSSGRFAMFLENQNLTISVARALLGGDCSDFSHDTIQRILEDLASDEVASRDVAVAKGVQRKIRNQGPLRQEEDAPPAIVGRLQIRRRSGILALEGVLPLVESAAADRLRRLLRRRRFAPKLWGVSSRVPSSQLLSGLPFPINLTSTPEDGAPLFQGLSDLELDAELRRLLESLQLDVSTPLLFAASSDGEVARSVLGKEISGNRIYWLLVAAEGACLFAGLPSLGEIGPYTCMKLDPSDTRALEALKDRGYRVQFGVAVSFAGAPPLDNEAPVLRFFEGDERVVVPQRAHPAGSHVEFGGARVALTDDLVRVNIPKGEHILEISSKGELRRDRLYGVKKFVSQAHHACWLELSAPELTVQALLSGTIGLKIDSLAPLEGLGLTIELEAAGRRVGATCPLGPLPQVLLGDHELWSTLLDESERNRILQDSSPILHARVGLLAAESWPLEQRVRPCWWVRDASGISLHSELGPLAHGVVAASDPTSRPSAARVEDKLEACLLSPLQLDDSKFGRAAEFTSFCLAPDSLHLEAPSMVKPRLCRRRSAERGSVGLEDLVKAYFRWALAESGSLVAEIRRRQVESQLDSWLVEICCGENWARAEGLVRATSADPWMLLFDECRETGLGRDAYVNLSAEDEERVARFTVAEIRRMHPELWARVGPPSDLEEHEYEALDLACGRAYAQLAEIYMDTGQEDLAKSIAEGDPGTAPDDWYAALERVKARSELRDLSKLLLPTDAAPRLMGLDLTLMPLAEITEELSHWTKDSKRALAGPVPDAAIIEAIIALWIDPEIAVARDWQGALNTLLAERSIARAARYLALRARSSRRRNGQ